MPRSVVWPGTLGRCQTSPTPMAPSLQSRQASPKALIVYPEVAFDPRCRFGEPDQPTQLLARGPGGSHASLTARKSLAQLIRTVPMALPAVVGQLMTVTAEEIHSGGWLIQLHHQTATGLLRAEEPN